MSIYVLERSTLAEQATSAISAQIVSGQLKPGERLTEAGLAQRFAVSRGPLREALRSLESLGLVERRGTQGTFVSNPSPDVVANSIVLRGLMEGLAARFAAGRPGTALPPLRAQVDAMRAAAAIEDTSAFFAAHTSFHATLCGMLDSALFDRILSLVRMQIGLLVRQIGEQRVGLDQIIRHHEGFLEAIASGDSDRAEHALRSRIILTGYGRLGLPIPPEIAGYVAPRTE